MFTKRRSWIIRPNNAILLHMHKLIIIRTTQHHSGFNGIRHVIKHTHSNTNLLPLLAIIWHLHIDKEWQYPHILKLNDARFVLLFPWLLTSIALFNMPKPKLGLIENADTIQWAGLAGTGRLKIKRPCGPMLTSFQHHTFSYCLWILLNLYFLNKASSVTLTCEPAKTLIETSFI